MLRGIINSVGVTATGPGGTGTLYIDKTDDNYGLGEGLTFHADAEDNIALGENALYSTTGAALRNVAIGTSSGTAITTGDDNILIGTEAGDQLDTEIDNIFIGSYAGAGSNQADACVGIGKEALNAHLTDDADGSVAVGHQALKVLTAGAKNTAIGYQAMLSSTLSVNNVAIGYAAMDAMVGDDANNAGNYNVAVGVDAMGAVNAGTDGSARADNNVAIGHLALQGGTFTAADRKISGNVAIGANCLDGSGVNEIQDCVSIGYGSMHGSVADTALGTVAIGRDSLASLTSGEKNVAVGYQALTAATTDDYNTAVGYQALKAVVGTNSNNNTAVGAGAGDSLITGKDNTFLGTFAGSSLGAGETSNVAIGKSAMESWDEGSGTFDANIAIGHDAFKGADLGGSSSATISGNIAIGFEAADNTGAFAGTDNIFIGSGSGSGSSAWITAASLRNIAIGADSMQGVFNATVDNVGVGHKVFEDLSTGKANVAVGSYAAGDTTTGVGNVAIGSYDAGNSFNAALRLNTVGSFNVAIGTGALSTANANDNDGTVAIGHLACKVQAGTGGAQFANATTAVGYKALTALTTGASNTAVGYQAGNILTTGGTNTIIGYDADVDANSRAGCIVIGSGLSLNTASDNVVEIGNNTNSMTYDLDGGDITVTSDVRTKKDIKDSKLGLEFINRLRPITYKTKPSSQYPKEFDVKQPSKKSSNKVWDGLIAQEVKEVMDEMNVGFSGWEEGINTKQRLAYGKFVMPLIKAVQELTAKVEALENA